MKPGWDSNRRLPVSQTKVSAEELWELPVFDIGPQSQTQINGLLSAHLPLISDENEIEPMGCVTIANGYAWISRCNRSRHRFRHVSLIEIGQSILMIVI